jgi:hypothetical protein
MVHEPVVIVNGTRVSVDTFRGMLVSSGIAMPVNAETAAPAAKVEPVPAPSSVIGNGSPSWMSDDLRVALQLVRAQFEALGIESITLTKTSTKFRRVVIEEGDVQI